MKYYCYKCGKPSAEVSSIYPPSPDDLLCEIHSLEKLLLVKLKKDIPDIVKWIIDPKGISYNIPIEATEGIYKHLVIKLEYPARKKSDAKS